jgi:hypothetical protein
MRKLTIVVLVAGLSFATGFAQTPGGRQLQITFEGSDVTLVASGVSIPEILREWARVSGCVVVNGDRLPHTPLPGPMRFEKQPQRKVIDALLRQAAGYFVAPRTASRPGASDFELIYVLATSSPVSTGYSGVTSSVQAPLNPIDSEIPPIPPAPPPVGQPQEPAPQNRPMPGMSSPAVPIIATPPATAPPPAGRGRGGS